MYGVEHNVGGVNNSMSEVNHDMGGALRLGTLDKCQFPMSGRLIHKLFIFFTTTH